MVKELLLEGRENAQSGRDLAARLGCTIRDLTATIEHERRAGVPICAHSGRNPGYYLAANKEELQEYCDALAHRAGEMDKTRAACIGTLDTLPGGAHE